MKEPIWVGLKLVLAIHQRQLAEHGGADGVRDEGLLMSALARPLNAYAYTEPKPKLADLAADYAFGLAKNHPFVDGNKRVAAVVCETFLRLNGHEQTSSDTEFYSDFANLAAGELSRDSLAKRIRNNLQPLP